jgi:hypothetical protein
MKEYDSPLGRSISSKGAMMLFNDQDRSGVVTLSAAKGLARWAQRCFAALILRCAQDDMTGVGR